jgi:hypothetical protein
MDNENQIDFSVDKMNLYREEGYSDLKVASIRKLIPIHPDGSQDKSRTEIFIGNTQLMSPEGPIPLQAVIPANTFEEAMDAFPTAMKKAMEEMIINIRKMQEQQQKEEKDESRIIVPGR